MKEEGRKEEGKREKGRNRIMERDRRGAGKGKRKERELRIVANRPDFMSGGGASFYDVRAKVNQRRRKRDVRGEGSVKG